MEVFHPISNTFLNLPLLPNSLLQPDSHQWSYINPHSLQEIDPLMLNKKHSNPKKKKNSPTSGYAYDQTTIKSLEEKLVYLHGELKSIEVNYRSIKGIFPSNPNPRPTEEYLDQVDRELGIAYDDLRTQIRSIEKHLKDLDGKMNCLRQQNSANPNPLSPPQLPSSSRSPYSAASHYSVPSTTSSVYYGNYYNASR